MLDKLENLSIKSVLIVAISAMVLLLVIVGATGILGIDHVLQADNAAKAKEIAGSVKFNMILTIVVAAFAALGIGGLLARMINKPLALAVEVANKVAEGDLSCHLDDVARNNEFGRLLSAQQNMERNLSEIVSQVRTGALEQFLKLLGIPIRY